MKTKKQIKEKIAELEDKNYISWNCAEINTAIHSAIAMTDALKWVLK